MERKTRLPGPRAGVGRGWDQEQELGAGQAGARAGAGNRAGTGLGAGSFLETLSEADIVYLMTTNVYH